MRRVTKKEAKARREAWSKALAEGRIVRAGLSMWSCPTVEQARAKVAALRAAGIPDAVIVRV